MNKEIRNIDGIEFRAIEEDGKKFIEGYALKFGLESKDLGGFREVIDKGSLDEADLSDVVALFNHNNNYVLARKNADVNTLELTITDEGLSYRFEVDEEVSYVKDLYLNIRKGNISKSSFAFYLPSDGSGEKWEKRDNQYFRYITKFSKISDVSPVTNPAYDNTTSMIRSFEDVKQELDKPTEVEPVAVIKSTSDEFTYKYHLLNK